VNVDDGTNPQVGGDEIQKASQLIRHEINDAVDELEGNGLVRTVKWMGTSPFYSRDRVRTPSIPLKVLRTSLHPE
jgi:hypothetical protein